jgi:molybdopterin molybdotransferase
MLLPVKEALDLALKNLPLQLALPYRFSKTEPPSSYILVADVPAPLSHPIFDQSAVDGYALRHEDFEGEKTLTLAEEIKAGDAGDTALKAGEAMRIFTGAPVPPGADTVVMQEFTKVNQQGITITDTRLKKGGNIRRQGEQIRKGDIALQAGERLNPAAIGFLASLGIREVQIRQPLKVKILVTGNEFAEDEGDLQAGKIFESNGQMLQAALAQEGIEAMFETVPDDLPTTIEMVRQAAESHDLVLVTGGVSVGDYDFTRPALEANDFKIVFHKVNQKPGKPLLYARKPQVTAFGLPGNPRSVLVGFYMYVLPHIHARTGAQQIGLTQIKLPLSHDFRKQSDGKTHFLTGRIDSDGVSILGGQGSHMLQSFARAGAIVTLPGEQTEYPAGSQVVVSLLPG